MKKTGLPGRRYDIWGQESGKEGMRGLRPNCLHEDRTDTYYGEALAAVRAGPEGPLRVSADDGTYSGQAVIPVLRPDPGTNGRLTYEP